MAEVPVKVAVRVRPLVGQEKTRNVAQCIQCLAGKNQLILGKDRSFTFDSVLSPATTQAEVYDECVEPLVKSCLEGYNATVFAYGQTGSGKTFTIGGVDSAGLVDEEYGVIHRAIKQIFHIIEENRHKTEFVLSVSYIEIYMEELRDLLDLEISSKDIHIREDENGNTVVVGATEQPVESADDVMSCLDAGSSGRHTGSTNMNEQSSRSHSVFTLYIEQKPLAEFGEDPPPGDKEHEPEIEYSGFKYSKFHFVDLAGSERAHRTGNVGERFKESVFINSGLLALGNVISALSDTKKKVLHVPYRDSKVTRLLKDSLGGNARTVMITCLSPCEADFAENLNSLKYATRARKIRNKPVVNRDPQNARLAEMQNEIQALREELQRRRGSSFGSTGTTEDREQVKSLEEEVKRWRSTCEAYKQLASEAGALLKSLHKAGAMSNQQTSGYERWLGALEQVGSRPLWTPNSAREQQAQLTEQLRKDLNKCKEDLASDEEIFAEKARQIEALRDLVQSLEEEKCQLTQQLQEAAARLKKHEDQLFQQQLQLNQQFSAPTHNGLHQDRLILSSPQTRKLRAQTAPVDQGGPEGEGGRDLHSSPPVFAVDRVIRDFRARSQLLVSQHEEEDEVVCLLSDSSGSENEADDAPERQLGRTWNVKKGPPRAGIPVATKNLQNKTSARRINGKRELSSAERKPGKPITDDDEMRALRASTHVISQQVRKSELRQHEAQQALRDLTINIRYKEELIKELVKSDKEAKEMKKQYAEKIKTMKHEVDKAKAELEETRKALEAAETNEQTEKHKIEAEYKKKLHSVESKLVVLKKKQKDNEKIGAMHEEREKKVHEMGQHIERMRSQQEQLGKKLKEEGERKMKMNKEMQKQVQKIRELEEQMTQQQKVLKRKTEEVAAAQRRLRTAHRAGSEEKDGEEQSKLEERRQWLDAEVEKIVKRKEAMEALEEDLKKREAILANKEALLTEKSELEIKKLRSSQVLNKDILRLSTQLVSLDQQLKQRGENPKQDQVHTLERSREELSKQRALLEQKLQEGSLLDPTEERRLIELDEGIEALEAAIEYKNDAISAKELDLSTDGAGLLDDKDRSTLTSKLKGLAPGETTALLTRYFEKVVQLRDSERRLQLSCSDLAVRVDEQERIIGELGRSLQQSQLKADRRLTEQQKAAEQRVQFLINKLRDAESGAPLESRAGELETRIQQLEKDLYYYKKTSRELKKKLRQNMAATGTSVESDAVGASGGDMELHSARWGGTGEDVGRSSLSDVARKHPLTDRSMPHSPQAPTPVRLARKDLRQLSSQEVSNRRSQAPSASSVPGSVRGSTSSTLPDLSTPGPLVTNSSVQDSLGDLVQDSIEQGRNPWT